MVCEICILFENLLLKLNKKFNKKLDPTFVASLTLGNYVYFFIRENAIEYMNCGEVGKFN